MEQKKIASQIQVKHALYLMIFLMTLLLRFSAASRLEVSRPESEILFSLTQGPSSSGTAAPVLYQLLTLPLISIFGSGLLVVRFWLVMAGSLMVLLPLQYEDLLGERGALILALLLFLDPFQISASLQINSGVLAILCMFLAIAFARKQQFLPAVLAFTAFCLSGLQFYYGILLALLFFIAARFNKKQAAFIEKLKSALSYIKGNYQKVGGSLLVLLMLVLMMGINISSVLGDLAVLISGWKQPYAVSTLPQLYPVVFFAYLPLGIFGIVFGAHSKQGQRLFTYLVSWIIVFLFLLTFYPAHRIVDLVWLSLPVCVLGALSMDALIDKIKAEQKNRVIYAVILLCVLVSLTISMSKVVYQIKGNLYSLNAILSAITLLVLVVMLLIFMAYNEGIALALNVFNICLLVVLIFVQISFSWRASGLNGNPSAELFWEGYFEGVDQVREIIDNADLESLDDAVNTQVAFYKVENTAVKWSVAADYPSEEQPFGLADEHYAVIISPSVEGDLAGAVDGYYGQSFVSSAYPLWIWQPFRSLASSDFWAWLFFRQGQMLREYDHIWVNKSIF